MSDPYRQNDEVAFLREKIAKVDLRVDALVANERKASWISLLRTVIPTLLGSGLAVGLITVLAIWIPSCQAAEERDARERCDRICALYHLEPLWIEDGCGYADVSDGCYCGESTMDGGVVRQFTFEGIEVTHRGSDEQAQGQ